MNNINIEPAVEYIKTLVDKNRCVICDLLNGPIVRYPCGHFVCKTCVKTAEDCLLCLSPPIVSTNFTDAPSSQRIEHVSLLLTGFQDLFNVDVYKRHRLSEQLKLEKQVFPKCIQAPTKYCNKRKSKGVQDKENTRVSFIAGESISNVSKMENTINYVQQWLKNNESTSKSNNNLPRRPFADLNVNDQSFTKDCSLVTKVNNNRVSCRKRTHIKVFDTSKRLLPKKNKKESLPKLISPKVNNKTYVQKSKCENDESGIVVDEETIVIDNSQEECIDKDKLALIAIKEAEKLKHSDFINCVESGHKSTFKDFCTSIDFGKIKSSLYKIPFYKKSLLYKVCNECTNENDMLHNVNSSKNLTVVIDGNQLVTTITFTQCLVKNVKIVNKKSVEIQTDTSTYISEINASEHKAVSQKHDEKALSLLHLDDIKSSDLFNDDVKISKLEDDDDDKSDLKNAKDINVSLMKDKCLIIEESDTDSDVSEKENTLEVTAEVHRAETYDDFGVLSTLEPSEYATRTKQSRVRGHTPLSTDSSDKENYDPNRMKRQKFGKKHCNKK